MTYFGLLAEGKWYQWWAQISVSFAVRSRSSPPYFDQFPKLAFYFKSLILRFTLMISRRHLKKSWIFQLDTKMWQTERLTSLTVSKVIICSAIQTPTNTLSRRVLSVGQIRNCSHCYSNTTLHYKNLPVTVLWIQIPTNNLTVVAKHSIILCVYSLLLFLKLFI